MSPAEPHLDLAHLRALCDAATPGPWRVSRGDVVACAYGFSDVVVAECSGAFQDDPQTAAYLAAVSPDVVRALLDRLERAEAMVS